MSPDGISDMSFFFFLVLLFGIVGLLAEIVARIRDYRAKRDKQSEDGK